MSLNEFPRGQYYTPQPSQWTGDKIDEAKRMWVDGYSASEIGIAVGASRNAVIGKLSRLGLSSVSRTQGVTLKYSLLAKVQGAKVGEWQGYPKPPTGRRNTRPDGFRRKPLPKNPQGGRPAHAFSPSALMVAIERSEAACSFAELSKGMCRYPYGDPREANFAFCGRHAAGTYCTGHHTIAYRRPA